MDLILDQYFTVCGDKNSFTLKYSRTYTDVDGKAVHSADQWYYPTIKLCLESYIDRAIGGLSPAHGVYMADQIIGEIKRTMQVIKELKIENKW